MIALLVVAFAAAAPNPALTPGAVRPLSVEQICETKWGADRRVVTEAMKIHVFAAYGIPLTDRTRYEVDHLVPRELGGADDLLNLWPQPWVGEGNAHVKDHEENRLHRSVCAGAMTLTAAQRSMRTWGR